MTYLRTYRLIYLKGLRGVADLRIEIRAHHVPKTRSDEWTASIGEWEEG